MTPLYERFCNFRADHFINWQILQFNEKNYNSTSVWFVKQAQTSENMCRWKYVPSLCPISVSRHFLSFQNISAGISSLEQIFFSTQSVSTNWSFLTSSSHYLSSLCFSSFWKLSTGDLTDSVEGMWNQLIHFRLARDQSCLSNCNGLFDVNFTPGIVTLYTILKKMSMSAELSSLPRPHKGKLDKPIITLICNLNILGPTPRGAHIFQRWCSFFTSEIQVELLFFWLKL